MTEFNSCQCVGSIIRPLISFVKWVTDFIALSVLLSKSPHIHDDVMKWKHFPRYWPIVRRIPGEFTAQRPVTRSLDIFFDLRLNKRLSKQSWGWWFETQSRPLWRHRNDLTRYVEPLVKGLPFSVNMSRESVINANVDHNLKEPDSEWFYS